MNECPDCGTSEHVIDDYRCARHARAPSTVRGQVGHDRLTGKTTIEFGSDSYGWLVEMDSSGSSNTSYWSDGGELRPDEDFPNVSDAIRHAVDALFSA